MLHCFFDGSFFPSSLPPSPPPSYLQMVVVKKLGSGRWEGGRGQGRGREGGRGEGEGPRKAEGGREEARQVGGKMFLLNGRKRWRGGGREGRRERW